MTPFTNSSHEKNKTIQTIHGSGISFATGNCQILSHFNEILMQIFNSNTYIPKQKLSYCSVAFLFRKVRAQRRKNTIADRVNEAQITIEMTGNYYRQQYFVFILRAYTFL
jgi:hypothetical protein